MKNENPFDLKPAPIAPEAPDSSELNDVTPAETPQHEYACRNEKLLIVTHAAPLCDKCFLCNEDVGTDRVQYTFYVHSETNGLVATVQMIITWLIPVLIFVDYIREVFRRRKAVLQIGVCRRHKRWKTMNIATTGALCIGGIIVVVLGFAQQQDIFLACGVTSMILAPIYYILTVPRLEAVHIDDDHMYIKGCCDAYLDNYQHVDFSDEEDITES